jgi:hypothetical protein
MPVPRHAAALVGVILLSHSLAGCGSISSFVAGGMADLIPAWAGGLPANAPPRPGTPEYDAMMKEREEKLVLPAAKAGPDPATSPSAEMMR